MKKAILFSSIQQKIKELESETVSAERKQVLEPLRTLITVKLESETEIALNFICTHNSRRSQLAQVWAKAISEYLGISINSYSGGTETTAFHPHAINALERAGFKFEIGSGENPVCAVHYSESEDPLNCYSKLYDSAENPSKNFAAVMTCSHADENCPFIPGAEARIPLDYSDPKEFDHTPQQDEKYDERSDQIASEMLYVFKNLN